MRLFPGAHWSIGAQRTVLCVATDQLIGSVMEMGNQDKGDNSIAPLSLNLAFFNT